MRRSHQALMGYGYYVVALILTSLSVWLLAFQTPKHALRIYLMPLCPYGKAALSHILDAYGSRSNEIDLQIYYIANDSKMEMPNRGIGTQDSGLGCIASQQTSRADQVVDGRFTSMHGAEEVREGMRQLYIKLHYPKQYISYLHSATSQNGEDWKSACSSLGISCDEVQKAIDTTEIEQRYATNIMQAVEDDIGLSPTIFLDGRRLQCSQPGYECLSPYIATIVDRPKERPGPAVYLPVITSTQCEACNYAEVDRVLQEAGGNLEARYIDVESKEAQEIVKGMQVQNLPLLTIPTSMMAQPWIKHWAERLPLKGTGQYKVVSVQNENLPFQRYGRLYREEITGYLGCSINHKRSAILLQHGDYLSSAKIEYWRALNENPNDAQSWNNLGAIYSGDSDKRQLAISSFLLALSHKPGYFEALINLVDAYEKSGQMLDAGKYASQCGWQYAEKGEFNNAEKYFRIAIAGCGPSYDVDKALAWTLIKQERPSESLPYLLFCKKHSTKVEWDVWNLLGGAYFRLGDWPNSEDAYMHAIACGQCQPEVFYNLLYLFKQRNEWNKLLGLISDHKIMPLNADALIYENMAFWETGAKNRSIKGLLQCKYKNPQSAFKVDCLLACYYFDIHCTTQAEQTLDEISSSRDVNQKLAYPDAISFATMSLSLSRPELAKYFLLRALESYPSSIDAHNRLAEIYRVEGNKSSEDQERRLAREFGG